MMTTPNHLDQRTQPCADCGRNIRRHDDNATNVTRWYQANDGEPIRVLYCPKKNHELCEPAFWLPNEHDKNAATK